MARAGGSWLATREMQSSPLPNSPSKKRILKPNPTFIFSPYLKRDCSSHGTTDCVLYVGGWGGENGGRRLKWPISFPSPLLFFEGKRRVRKSGKNGSLEKERKRKKPPSIGRRTGRNGTQKHPHPKAHSLFGTSHFPDATTAAGNPRKLPFQKGRGWSVGQVKGRFHTQKSGNEWDERRSVGGEMTRCAACEMPNYKPLLLLFSNGGFRGGGGERGASGIPTSAFM